MKRWVEIKDSSLTLGVDDETTPFLALKEIIKETLSFVFC